MRHSDATRHAGITGQNHYRALLTNQQARRLRLDYAAGEPTASLSGRYGVSPAVLRQIALGKRYPSAGGPVTRRNPRRCDDLTAFWIRMLAADCSDQDLAAKFGLGADMVKRIRCGISYAWLNEVLPKVTRAPDARNAGANGRARTRRNGTGLGPSRGSVSINRWPNSTGAEAIPDGPRQVAIALDDRGVILAVPGEPEVVYTVYDRRTRRGCERALRHVRGADAGDRRRAAKRWLESLDAHSTPAGVSSPSQAAKITPESVARSAGTQRR